MPDPDFHMVRARARPRVCACVRDCAGAKVRHTCMRTVGQTRSHRPLDRFSQLDYSTASGVSDPNRVLMENPRRELSENMSFDDAGITLVAE